jgi:hypothetical protein
MLKEAFDDNVLGLMQTYDCFNEWHECFMKGQVSVDNDKHFGWPSTGGMIENVVLWEAVLEDQKQMIHDACDIVKLSSGICQRILSHELNIIISSLLDWKCCCAHVFHRMLIILLYSFLVVLNRSIRLLFLQISWQIIFFWGGWIVNPMPTPSNPGGWMSCQVLLP